MARPWRAQRGIQCLALCFIVLLGTLAAWCQSRVTFDSDPPGATLTAIVGSQRIPLGTCGQPLTPHAFDNVDTVQIQFTLEGYAPLTRNIDWDKHTNVPRAEQSLHVVLEPASMAAQISTLLRHHPIAVGTTSLFALILVAVCATRLRRQQHDAHASLREHSKKVQSALDDPLSGSTLGQWRLMEPIGAGATATVYHAVPTKGHDGETRAVKVLASKYSDDDELRKRFAREYEFAQSFSHPSLLRVDEWGEQDGHPYLVMEMVEGTSLRDTILPGGLPTDEVMRIVRPLFLAVHDAHTHGVIHRDLKPENIMRMQNGVKVMDFGLARNETLSRMTESGTVLGTPAYIAPEQIMQSHATDARADQYALGVILFELLTGRPPFQADDPFALLNLHLTEDPPALRALRPDLSAQLAAIVARMLLKDPTQRYPTVADALQALEAAVSNATSATSSEA